MTLLVVYSDVASICCEEGQRWKLCHGALTMDFRTGCSSCSMNNGFVTNAVLIERAVSCWHLHQLISQTTQYLDSWLSDLLQSELKWNCWKSREGSRAPVPHSWRRHRLCISCRQLLSWVISRCDKECKAYTSSRVFPDKSTDITLYTFIKTNALNGPQWSTWSIT